MSAESLALAANETPLSAKLDAAEISNLAPQTGGASERMTASLAQHISNADDELGKVISELQEVREFLRSEAERLQRDESLLAETGIRALRRAPVFTTPNIYPPPGFEQQAGEAKNGSPAGISGGGAALTGVWERGRVTCLTRILSGCISTASVGTRC